MAKAWQALEMNTAILFDALLNEMGICELDVRKTNPNFALNIPDYRNSIVAVECKSKKQSFPKSILDAFDELDAYPDAKGKIQIVALHKNPRGKNYVILEFDDLQKLVHLAAEVLCASRNS